MDSSLIDNETCTPPLRVDGRPCSPHELALRSTDEARALLPYENAIKMRAIPLALVREGTSLRLHCVVANDSPELRRALHFVTDVEPLCSVGAADVIDEAIIKAYLSQDRRVRDDIERLTRTRAQDPATVNASFPEPTGDAAKFLATLVEFAVAQGASDLHLCPSPQGAFIRLRIDGELLTQAEHHYPGAVHEQVVSRLKVLAGLDIACRHLPQDGSCVLPVGNTTKSVRVSTLPTVHGESVVMRLLYSRRLPRLSALGVEPVTMARLRTALTKTSGIILLTGPTGSGKTTTMYSLALELQHRGRNVVTVEDPVEAPLPGMVQVQVREGQGLDYPRAIRSVLRHDPDVILIGEMRDPISARIALTAAVTGHLTVSSLHMGSALQALERLRSFDISARESVQGVSLVVNQRLIPRLCAACKVVDMESTTRFNRTLYTPIGCQRCDGTGFEGRVLITETLDVMSAAVKEAYSGSKSMSEALSAIPASAFIPWTRALEFHLTSGDISPRQVQEFVDEEMAPE